MKILGIETSCDETAASVVQDGHKLLSNTVASSIDLHKAYGGVVPEIAARSHVEAINPVIKQALGDAGCDWRDIDGVAVTYGPGLSGSLLVGVLAARTLAIVKNKPLFPVNHVEAHVYAAFLTSQSGRLKENLSFPAAQPRFPLLALIVSGGHTQLVLFEDHFQYRLLGRTHDDAVGEAFDKVAKILGLPYPGGPSIEKSAKKGDPGKYRLPIPKTADQYGFSYSGLKTATLRTAQKLCGESHDFPSHQLADRLNAQQKLDLAASFQQAALAQLVDKTSLACQQFQPANVVIAGGVAASLRLREIAEEKLAAPVIYADPRLCTDNGAMVAALGCFMKKPGQKPADPKTLDVNPGLSM
jgi:N6-L-threonylcarbamoyladenine synthase